jgi:hypothetical protein
MHAFMVKFVLILFLFFALQPLFSQVTKGNVTIHQDPAIDSLVKKHIEINKLSPCIKGWRINIFFEAGNLSKRMAVEAKSHFVENHADIPCYLIFQEPYYKIRIGDFRTKVEAVKVLKEITAEYPNAFVVEDDINFPQL